MFRSTTKSGRNGDGLRNLASEIRGGLLGGLHTSPQTDPSPTGGTFGNTVNLRDLQLPPAAENLPAKGACCTVAIFQCFDGMHFPTEVNLAEIENLEIPAGVEYVRFAQQASSEVTLPGGKRVTMKSEKFEILPQLVVVRGALVRFGDLSSNRRRAVYDMAAEYRFRLARLQMRLDDNQIVAVAYTAMRGPQIFSTTDGSKPMVLNQISLKKAMRAPSSSSAS